MEANRTAARYRECVQSAASWLRLGMGEDADARRACERVAARYVIEAINLATRGAANTDPLAAHG